MKHFPFRLSKTIAGLLLGLILVACGARQSVTPGEPASTASSSDSISTPKINLNTASDADFLTIPGVGNRMVREFTEYRPYVSIQQFRREIGKYVDAGQVTEYEKYIFVPVDVNQADTETLKQLPGVDDVIASELIGGRPYASNENFLAKLANHISAAELTIATSYLARP